MTEPKDYKKIAAVDRALALLEALADRPDQGVTSLAKSLGMTKSLGLPAAALAGGARLRLA